MDRRIAAIHLRELPCELVRRRIPVEGPLGVLVDRAAPSVDVSQKALSVSQKAESRLDFVDELARRIGLCPGLRVTEATALTSQLSVHHVTEGEINLALGAVAEVALSLGSSVSIGSPVSIGSAGSFCSDTVWLDITGAAHLVGGELDLKAELQRRVEELGHRCRVAIADGPRIARALAQWGEEPLWAPVGGGGPALAPLPVKALPIDDETLSFFLRLGIITVGDLARLPRAGAAMRMGSGSRVPGSRVPADVLALVHGHDPMPLVPFSPPEVLAERTLFEEGVDRVEALLFVLRGMTSRLASRLEARGAAAARLEIAIDYDRSIARLQTHPDETVIDAERWPVELPQPLRRADDLFRAVRAKLESRTATSRALFAPAVGIALELNAVTPQRKVQLDLSRDQVVDPDALIALLAELGAEVGSDRVGCLAIEDAHRPEKRSRLKAVSIPVATKAHRGAFLDAKAPFSSADPTRLLPEPLPLGPVSPRMLLNDRRALAVGHHLYQVDAVEFSLRLSGVEWWTGSGVSRDYARVTLSSRGEHPGLGDAWIYWDRAVGEAFLHGWWE